MVPVEQLQAWTRISIWFGTTYVYVMMMIVSNWKD